VGALVQWPFSSIFRRYRCIPSDLVVDAKSGASISAVLLSGGEEYYRRHWARDNDALIRPPGRSEWPEYAVKVISTSKIRELGYEASVSREIAVLRLLSHPGIARMVSAFRWRDGAYLVLEYASRGDLHSYVVANGSLDEESTRFVVGEVIAALRSVHDAGFVFGDLKLENIVLTESGHVKLADFGACRPINEQARRILRGSRGAVRSLRDGDWIRSGAKGEDDDDATAMIVENPGHVPEGDDDAHNPHPADEEDTRIEGTLAYLPPEVIRDGALPDQLADSWALGCVLFHCMAGRPPVFADLGQDIRARVVSFAVTDGVQALLAEAPLGEDVKGLVQGLLASDKSRRFTLEAAALHAFFTASGVDVYALHRM
jgi:serine/threonine protein kinase